MYISFDSDHLLDFDHRQNISHIHLDHALSQSEIEELDLLTKQILGERVSISITPENIPKYLDILLSVQNPSGFESLRILVNSEILDMDTLRGLIFRRLFIKLTGSNESEFTGNISFDACEYLYLWITNDEFKVPLLPNLGNIRYLMIEGGKLTDQSLEYISKYFVYLAELEVNTANTGKNMDVYPILQLKNMHILRFHHCDLEELYSSQEDIVSNLQLLDLENTKINNIGEVLKHMPFMETLNLDHNRIETVSNIDNLVNLEELFLHNNPLSQSFDLNFIHSCLSLNFLSISKNSQVSKEIIDKGRKIVRLFNQHLDFVVVED